MRPIRLKVCSVLNKKVPQRLSISSKTLRVEPEKKSIQTKLMRHRHFRCLKREFFFLVSLLGSVKERGTKKQE